MYATIEDSNDGPQGNTLKTSHDFMHRIYGNFTENIMRLVKSTEIRALQPEEDYTHNIDMLHQSDDCVRDQP